MDGFFTYNDGPGPQTPLDRGATPGAPPVRAAEQGFGTDSGLATPLDRGTSAGSAATGVFAPMGNDSGLTTPVGR